LVAVVLDGENLIPQRFQKKNKRGRENTKEGEIKARTEDGKNIKNQYVVVFSCAGSSLQ
jgi:hypothetical protein